MPCEICGKPVENYKPHYCCNSHECDCRGRPINPCVCGERCYAALMDSIGFPMDERRQIAGIPKWSTLA